jgi:hypothetical protein
MLIALKEHVVNYQLLIPPLIVNSAGARSALGCGKTKFQRLVRNDPDFPKPIAGSCPNKPQWLWASLVAYVDHKAIKAND